MGWWRLNPHALKYKAEASAENGSGEMMVMSCDVTATRRCPCRASFILVLSLGTSLLKPASWILRRGFAEVIPAPALFFLSPCSSFRTSPSLYSPQ